METFIFCVGHLYNGTYTAMVPVYITHGGNTPTW
jgi:hypothetical protein